MTTSASSQCQPTRPRAGFVPDLEATTSPQLLLLDLLLLDTLDTPPDTILVVF